jgi:hypothetical protein
VSWTAQRQRGGIGPLRLVAAIALGLGWRAGHALMYPVTLVYLLSSPARMRRASRRYLARALGRPARWGDLWRLYFAFAATLLDRAFLLTGRTDHYEVSIEGLELMHGHAAAGRGCILLGAHMGSFDALRSVGGAEATVEIRVLMHRHMADAAHALFNALDPSRAASIITLGDPAAMIEASECLERGGVVGILGDRAPRGERMLAVPFLGRDAPFPGGPLQLAAILRAPVLLCFGLWLGPRRYALRFEAFADRVVLDRANRDAALREWLTHYAARLAELCRAHPYNWFNFYDFWQEEEARS